MIGETINGYTITHKLGEGGMAVVYQAQNEIGKLFAVKVLKDEITQISSIRSRFRQEADIMVILDDVPGIRKVHDLTETEDGKLIVIMEYLDGMDLNEYVKKNGPFKDISTVKRICNQVLMALEEAHNRGIIHRDIKPSNLFYTKDGYIKILDFGISKVLFGDDEETFREATTTTKFTGTLAYMSPEQIRCDKDIDGRTDIYSFGLTLFYLLTNEDPALFEGESLSGIADEQVVNAIKKATRKNRDNRIKSCEELLNFIQQKSFHTPKNEKGRDGGTTMDKYPEISLSPTSSIYYKNVPSKVMDIIGNIFIILVFLGAIIGIIALFYHGIHYSGYDVFASYGLICTVIFIILLVLYIKIRRNTFRKFSSLGNIIVISLFCMGLFRLVMAFLGGFGFTDEEPLAQISFIIGTPVFLFFLVSYVRSQKKFARATRRIKKYDYLENRSGEIKRIVKDGYFGLFDENALKTLLKPKYKYISPVIGSHLWVVVNENDKYGIYNFSTRKFSIPFLFDHIDDILLNERVMAQKAGNTIYLDRTGNILK